MWYIWYGGIIDSFFLVAQTKYMISLFQFFSIPSGGMAKIFKNEYFHYKFQN
jgi:hypothetical protein